jgi:3'(2'), 5'-bisphosphate nucleotidase
VGGPPSDQGIVDKALLAELTAQVALAAAAILTATRIVRIKADQTPVTDADECSQAILLQAMARLMPGVAVVSEEMAAWPSRLGDVFALIDPLDGTKEYIAGSSEYTVNLAIIQNGEPVAGIVAVPAEGLIYRGCAGQHAERLAISRGVMQEPATAQPIKIRSAPRDGLVAAVSRSHLDSATVALLDRLHVGHRVACGSALKFCRVAEGSADMYPRLATTCEWDVAAGHALLVAAGGTVMPPEGGMLRYGDSTANFRIPAFIAWGDRTGVLDAASSLRGRSG